MSCGLHRMTWLRPGMGCSLPSMSFIWLGISSLHPGASCGSLKRSYALPMTNCAIKVALLDGVRREDSEAVKSAERLNEECCGLRGDLHQ